MVPPIYSRAPWSHIVQAPFRQWVVILDAYRISEEDSIKTDQPTWWTRMRVPFLKKGSFNFCIDREDANSKLGRWLMGDTSPPDIDVGDPGFDRSFYITGSDEAAVQTLLANPRIRQLLQSQPHVKLGFRDRSGDPLDRQRVIELYCKTAGLVTDIEELRSLYELVTETFLQLHAMGAVSDEPPKLARDSYRY